MRQSSLTVKSTPYFAVDIAKFVAAFLVATIHVPMAQQASPFFLIWVREGFARIAVPFFFCVTGFFLTQQGLDNAKSLRHYVKRIAVLYLVWSVAYLPFVFEAWRDSSIPVREHILTLVRNSFFTGSYLHLWYFPALLVGVALLYAVRRLPMTAQLCLAAWLYLLGVLGNAYEAHARQLLHFLRPVADLYFRIFLTTRNGLLFAFPLLCMGAFLARRGEHGSVRMHAAGLGASLLLLGGEVAWLQWTAPEIGRDMMFALVPVVYFLMALLLRAGRRDIPATYFLRESSALVYVLHPMVFALLQRWMPLEKPLPGALQYALVLAVCVAVSVGIVLLQHRPPLRWLHYFY